MPLEDRGRVTLGRPRRRPGMSTRMKRYALVVVLAAAACLPAEPEVFTVTISGVVTEASLPISGAMLELLRLSEVTGLPESVAAATTSANGAFSFSTETTARFCDTVRVTVDVPGPTGASLYSDGRNASGCGDNTINFDF